MSFRTASEYFGFEIRRPLLVNLKSFYKLHRTALHEATSSMKREKLVSLYRNAHYFSTKTNVQFFKKTSNQ
ncbi:hypothetical protein ACM26V_02445 [Salipaludibacillus sp. HK11]|uniref:hypothetical protein n=1 Tax=Salipaludibacillus sp. HK11 TaxID=3394320 RepID=UPI0039FDAE32